MYRKQSNQRIRSTKDGKLLVTTDMDEVTLKSIQDIIKNSNNEVKITRAGEHTKTITLHIRGLDVDATMVDLINAIQIKTNNLEYKDYKLSDLLPNRNQIQTATLTINETHARTLLKDGELRVGLVQCIVERNVIVRQCQKCWSYEHGTDAYNGPDRSDLCDKCEKKGMRKRRRMSHMSKRGALEKQRKKQILLKSTFPS